MKKSKVMTIREYLNNIPKRLIDKKENKKIISVYTYVIMSCISFFMTALNIFTPVGILKYFTLGMGIACIINLILVYKCKNGINIAMALFSLEIIALFTFFIISGNPKGFSIIWISLLPPISMLFYGSKKGSVLCGAMLIILLFFLWVPFGKSLLMKEAKENYSATFTLRFPFLYIGCYFLALILETIRSIAYKTVEDMNDFHKKLTFHDQLTGLYNRNGLKTETKKLINENGYLEIGVGIIDIDFFKKINDDYGHEAGDLVLTAFAEILKKELNALSCRWGGDEFAFIYFDKSVTFTKLNDFRKRIQNQEFITKDNKKLNITITVGVYETIDKNFNNLDIWFKKADETLYNAKENGKNQVYYYGKKY